MNEQIPATMGEKIRSARLRKGLSGQQLGRAIGKTQAYISSLENAKRQPSLTTLREIARALDRPLHYFLEGAPLEHPGGLAQRLDDARNAHGLSVPQLAALSSVSSITIQRVLRGYTPDDDTIRKLATALHLSPAELAGTARHHQLEERMRDIMSDPNVQQVVYRFTEQFPNRADGKAFLVQLLEDAVYNAAATKEPKAK